MTPILAGQVLAKDIRVIGPWAPLDLKISFRRGLRFEKLNRVSKAKTLLTFKYLKIDFSSLVTGCCWLLIVGCWLPVAGYSRLTTHK